MTTPKPTRGSVGPGTLDQELQEHKGLHHNRITSKGPSDFQGNQKAKVAAAKGLLPHKDHRGPGATRGSKLQEPQEAPHRRSKGCWSHRGSNSHRAPTGGLQRTWGSKAAVKDHYQPVGPGATMLGTTRATTRADGIPLQSTSGTRILWKSGPGPISIAVIRKRYVPNKCLIVKRCTDGAKPVRGKQSQYARADGFGPCALLPTSEH